MTTTSPPPGATIAELEAKLAAADVVVAAAKSSVRAEQHRRRRAEEQYDKLVERLGRFAVAELYRRTEAEPVPLTAEAAVPAEGTEAKDANR